MSLPTLTAAWALFDTRYLVGKVGAQQRSDMRIAFYNGALAVLDAAAQDGSPACLNGLVAEVQQFINEAPSQRKRKP